ncbi:NAD-dependent dehydratase [Pseudomonas sp. 1D4]|uniref:UDP-glucose 4-epimerase family protein n=1 Tax=Pseudomonadaceae TaxID=135621 RepID=UPI00084B4CC8|nr:MULTISPECIES: SDR family oxidoreductase [Pseudomonas]OEC40026.1 NAD-dependent dehydratase [Pseudomonas sp. 1D4]
MSLSILVTGASGFVGRALVGQLSRNECFQVRAASRQVEFLGGAVESFRAPELGAGGDWRAALEGIHTVIHCAARVHVIKERLSDPLAEFRRVNVDGSLRLARQAIEAGVRRFIFVSSIKVNGEQTLPGQVFRADDKSLTCDPYGVSKREAENGLMAIAATTGLEVVIVRPPLIYGPGVKANFLSMLRCVSKGVPLPLGAIDNCRSLVALDNLTDLLELCITHPAAAGQRFLVSDGEDISTTELLHRLGQALGRPARLLRVPQSWIKCGALLIGRQDLSRRICCSLQVNIDKTREVLGWSPLVSVNQALIKTAKHYLECQRL